MLDAPFRVGERIRSDQLVTWNYLGLSGRPGHDRLAVRRYRKGDWVLEIRANLNVRAPSVVTSIRTSLEDDAFWKETRARLMRNQRPVKED